MLTHLVLDIGNVLSEWSPDLLIASAFADPAERERAHQATIAHPDWLELDKGAMTVNEAARRATERSGLDPVEVKRVYANLPASLVAIEQTHAAVRRLHAQGVPMLVLSNMQHACWDWLRANHEIYALFEGCVISAEVGLIKPDPAIYRHLTERFSLQPSDCLFVDDMAVNVEAARAAGWQSERLSERSEGGAVLERLAGRFL